MPLYGQHQRQILDEYDIAPAPNPALQTLETYETVTLTPKPAAAPAEKEEK